VSKKDLIITILIAAVVWAVTHFLFLWLPHKHILSLIIAILGSLLAVTVFSLATKFGLTQRSSFVWAFGAVGSLAFLLLGSSQYNDWESITIDCQANPTVDLPEAYVNLDGLFFWKEKNGFEFRIENIKEDGTGAAKTPFREGFLKKWKIDSIIAGKTRRTKGDRAKEEGRFKYDILCVGNNRRLDPIIQIPRPM
jgi:hypothetical protein